MNVLWQESEVSMDRQSGTVDEEGLAAVVLKALSVRSALL